VCTIKEKSIDNLLRSALQLILETGSHIKSTKGSNYEIRGVTLVLENPLYRLSSSYLRGKAFSPVGELLWYLNGSDQLDFISYYIKTYNKFSDDKKTLYGSYGTRVFNENGNQFENVVKLLKERPSTKQAIVQVLKPEDLFVKTKDLPCTMSLQFLVRDNKLEMYTYMRSNDVIKGFIHDVFCFTFLQEIMARRLGYQLGTYTHVTTSLHLYEEDVQNAKDYIEEGLFPIKYAMPEMPADNIEQSISEILKIEKQIREETDLEKLKQFKFATLDSYWTDIANVLIAYKFLVLKSWEDFELIASKFANPYYKRFIFDKLSNKK